MKLKINSALICLFAFGLTACPAKKSSDQNQGPSKVIFVQGDPHALIAGAQMNGVSLITVDNVLDWNNYSLMDLSQFVEKQTVVDTTDKNVKQENATKDEPAKSSEFRKMQMQQAADGHWQMSLLSGKIILDLQQSPDGELKPVQATDGKSPPVAVHALHWSKTPDGTYASLLLETQSPDEGRALIALYFEKTAPLQAIPTTDSKYIYALGAGKKMGWPLASGPSLTVHLCGAPELLGDTQNAVNLWNQALAGRFNILFQAVSSFAPFSDLNEHCIYMTNAYLIDSDKDSFIYGGTVSVGSRARLEIVDADIFIFQAEWQKMYNFVHKSGYGDATANSVRDQRLPMTLVHEMGHMLGLGHKFDGTPSVMSYEFQNLAPTSYDIAALSELYPLL